MNRSERIENPEEAIRTALEGFKRNLWTAVPVKVVSYDGTKQTVQLQPTTMVRVQQPDGSVSNQPMPVIPRAPVHWGGSGGWFVTHQIGVGDEGIALICSRSLDGWMNAGGIQPPTEARYNDLTDAVFIPGINSQPNNLSNVTADGIEIRNRAGDIKVKLTSGGISLSDANGNIINMFDGGIRIVGVGGVNINGAVIDDNGDITTKHGTSLDHHVNTGVTAGGSNSGPPP